MKQKTVISCPLCKKEIPFGITHGLKHLQEEHGYTREEAFKKSFHEKFWFK